MYLVINCYKGGVNCEEKLALYVKSKQYTAIVNEFIVTFHFSSYLVGQYYLMKTKQFCHQGQIFGRMRSKLLSLT